MLFNRNRLRKKKDFEKVLKEGKSFREDSLVLKIKKNKLQEVRFGFIVSQKVSKKAVIRNKVKRRLREAVKEEINKIRKGFDIILISLPSIKGKDFQEIKTTIKKLFNKAKILSL